MFERDFPAWRQQLQMRFVGVAEQPAEPDRSWFVTLELACNRPNEANVHARSDDSYCARRLRTK